MATHPPVSPHQPVTSVADRSPPTQPHQASTRVLVTWGSKRGGTEGIGRMIADRLSAHGFEVTGEPADGTKKLDDVDAVIVGGALYANRWPANVRHFVARNVEQLRRVPVWLFSSGPLDDSADRRDIPAPTQVAVLGERVGAKRHVTFGGRLEPDAAGFPASAMAKKMSGDWRNSVRIRAWADELAEQIPEATPGEAIEHPARSIRRLTIHGVVGWALCAATMIGLLQALSVTAALALHAVAAPLLFGVIAWHYFRERGARDPLPTAITWTTIVMLLDFFVVAGAMQGSLEMFASVAGTWLPFALIFLATWAVGALMSTMPWPKDTEAAATESKERGPNVHERRPRPT